MKYTIDVKDRREGDAIKTALEDPELRASAVCLGTLKGLPKNVSDRVLVWLKEARGLLPTAAPLEERK